MSDFSKMIVTELRVELKARGLSVAGSKADLIKRLNENKGEKRKKPENDEEEEDEEKEHKPKRTRGKKAAAAKSKSKKASKRAKKDEEEDEEEEEDDKKESKGEKDEGEEGEKEEDKDDKSAKTSDKKKGKQSAKEEEEDTKEAAQEAHGDWKFEGTLMFWNSPDLKRTEKLACFDFDGCLAETSLFKKGPDAWKTRHPNVPKRLKELSADGYELVIMTNQSDIGKARPENRPKMIAEKVGRLTSFAKEMGLPFQILVATAKAKDAGDKYRKPAAGMWTYINANNGGVTPDKDKCFFVGDAAGRNKVKGRGKDHSDADKAFAKNAGLKFFTEDEFFENEASYK